MPRPARVPDFAQGGLRLLPARLTVLVQGKQAPGAVEEGQLILENRQQRARIYLPSLEKQGQDLSAPVYQLGSAMAKVRTARQHLAQTVLDHDQVRAELPAESPEQLGLVCQGPPVLAAVDYIERDG